MNNDLISREALREDLRRFFPTEVLEGIEPKILFAQIMHDIDNAPIVEPERPQGEWIAREPYTHETFCPFCKEDTKDEVYGNFCPNCGADMRGGAE